jgi:hypothetical protein
LSDGNGFDPYIHDGTPDGILRELTNAFVTARAQPELADLRVLYQRLGKSAAALKKRESTDSLFTPRHFRILVATAQEAAARLSLLH